MEAPGSDRREGADGGFGPAGSPGQSDKAGQSTLARMQEIARHNGWAQVFPRAAGSAGRRLRDRVTARRLGTQGFHVGRNPRLLGLANMRIGRGFEAGDDLWLEAVTRFGEQVFQPEILIGEGVHLSDRVHVGCIARVSIGSGTLLGSGVLVSDHTHGVYRGAGQSAPEVPPNRRPLWSAGPVEVGRNVWIGDGVAVLAGATIGDGAVIGANSVVAGAIPAATMAVGSPARVVRRWDTAAGEWVASP